MTRKCEIWRGLVPCSQRCEVRSGRCSIQQGVIDASALSDALARQSGRHPVASELYALGYASERQLAIALSAQTGWSAHRARRVDDPARRARVRVARVGADLLARSSSTRTTRRSIVAAARPEDAIVPARELGAARGKNVELRIALDITLARTIRVAFQRWKVGELLPRRARSRRARASTSRSSIPTAATGRASPRTARARRGSRARDRARGRAAVGGRLDREHDADRRLAGQHDHDDAASADNDRSSRRRTLDHRGRSSIAARRRGRRHRTGRTRALIVDPDPPGRIQLVAELERLGYECQAASAGRAGARAAARRCRSTSCSPTSRRPSSTACGMCRAIKRSRRLVAHARRRHDVRRRLAARSPTRSSQQHGADGYLEKPLDPRRLHRLLRDLSTEEQRRSRGAPRRRARPLSRRRHRGRDRAACAVRSSPIRRARSCTSCSRTCCSARRAGPRRSTSTRPSSSSSRTYFPALTRLAYLYFRQGLHARAVETWRRALPVCEDPALRRNIELFMRKLVADMSKHDSNVGVALGAPRASTATGTDLRDPRRARAASAARGTCSAIPGIRSDSDMYTLGYRVPAVGGDARRSPTARRSCAYVEDTARELRHRPQDPLRATASMRAELVDVGCALDRRRRIDAGSARRELHLRASCSCCAGYYDYAEGYTPELRRACERFRGRIVHPQHWPEDLDYAGKRVVVIGSGATAVTLVPAMAKQRRARDDAAALADVRRRRARRRTPIADWLRARDLPAKLRVRASRAGRTCCCSMCFFNTGRALSGAREEAASSSGVREAARRQATTSPRTSRRSYNPWDQRLCLVPDADLFSALAARHARRSSPTRSRRSPRRGIAAARPAQQLDADIVVTATGLHARSARRHCARRRRRGRRSRGTFRSRHAEPERTRNAEPEAATRACRDS